MSILVRIHWHLLSILFLGLLGTQVHAEQRIKLAVEPSQSVFAAGQDNKAYLRVKLEGLPYEESAVAPAGQRLACDRPVRLYDRRKNRAGERSRDPCSFETVPAGPRVGRRIRSPRAGRRSCGSLRELRGDEKTDRGHRAWRPDGDLRRRPASRAKRRRSGRARPNQQGDPDVGWAGECRPKLSR